MCNPFRIQCGRDSSPTDARVHLQLGSRADADANVFLEIERLLQAVWREIPTVLHDLIEIACYVYAADQSISRGDTWIPAEGELGRGWRRDLQFHIPVRHPDIWQQLEVSNTLVTTLGVLSEDRYEFVFRPLDREQPLQARLGFTETPYEGMIDEVMLFSGGLDSLSGAVQEVLVDRRKVLLVHHRSNEKLAPRHHRLLADFEQLAKATPPIHIPVWMNKSKALGVEFTQRTRSFVFMALAATLATMVGRDRIRFYENGVVSLNLPLSAQVVGARTTRTTHPMVLNGYAQLVSLLIQKPFRVENPFIWETKTQIVERIARAGGSALIGHSTSCAHTWTRTMAHPHCGICSQCIDRRFAVLAAGQGSHDPAAGYEVDLMTGERDVGESRMMLAGFLERANQLERMNEKQFFSTYGQTSRVFRHLPGSASEVAEWIYTMYRRHACDVARVVDQGFRDHVTAIRQRTLPSSCLLRLVADPANPQPPRREVPAVMQERNLFRKQGQVWEIRFDGGPVNRLIDSKGAAYLHQLLAQPGQSWPVVKLAYAVARNGRAAPDRSEDSILDEDALDAYRNRLLELSVQRAKAEADNNVGVIADLDAEYLQIEKELSSAVSPRGQNRTLKSERDRLRKSVGNAVRRAIKQIAKYDKTLATHLQKPVLTCGSISCYQPVKEIVWATN